MEPFIPGQAFGYHYTHFVWVCTNPVTRSFEQCDLTQGVAVLQAFQRKVMEYGLSRSVFVFNSGCILGCKQDGTTVAIVNKALGELEQPPVLYFRNVQVKDVDTLIREYLLPHPRPA